MVIREATLADAHGIGRVNVDSWRTTYQGIVPDEFLARMSYEGMETRWKNILSMESPGIVFVAEEDETGEILGYVYGGKAREYDNKFTAELYAIYLQQNTQQQGLGRRLTLALAEKLAESRMTSMLVWVLADNPSLAFYEKLGGQYVTVKKINIGGAELDEIAYGWEDIRTMR